MHADLEKDAPHLLTAQHAQLAPTAVIARHSIEWRICAKDAPHLLTAQHAQLAHTAVIARYSMVWRICPVDCSAGNKC